MKVTSLGQVIATRTLTLDGKDAITVRIGMPYSPPEYEHGNYVCPYQIEGLGSEIIRFYQWGVDAIQALELAQQIIGVHLYASEEGAAGRIEWLGMRKLGFPVPYSSIDLLPEWQEGRLEMNGLTVRPARADEYPVIGEITVAAYNALEENISAAHLEYVEMLRDVETRARDAEVFVAVDANDRVLGSVTLVLDAASSMSEWDEPGAAGFRMLAVAPKAQGLGVGRLLTQFCVTRAREAGANAMLIHSRDIMTKARLIYRALGFRRYPEIDFKVEDIRLDGFRLEL